MDIPRRYMSILLACNHLKNNLINILYHMFINWHMNCFVGQ